MAKALMVVGTTSHAGKSMITTVLCRWLAQQGYRVAPFKGQNMALNAYVTQVGDEIGHAQAVQAWAAKVEPQVEMNPVLLKPQGNMTSQVIIKGKPVGTVQAADYYRLYFDQGWQAIVDSLNSLQTFDWIVCEGAGSPAEINLKHRDLTNMRVAKHLNAPTILVADIDRGGVFAHVVGTLELLDPDERVLICGIVINKFRGQRSLLDSGVSWLENYTGIPVLGVVPWIDQAFPAEDSLSLLDRRSPRLPNDLDIAVIRLPRVSNFTDFDPLIAEATLNLRYCAPGDLLGTPDAVILPGSKNTVADLQVLQQSGLAKELQTYAQNGGEVVGICGGFQMLGTTIHDPLGIEQKGSYSALNLLPIETTLHSQKQTRQQRTHTCPGPVPDLNTWQGTITGFEIHQGQTQCLQPARVAPLFTNPDLGLISREQSVWGSYLHGLFNNGPWRRQWLNHLRARKGLPPLNLQQPDYAQQRDDLLQLITDTVIPYLTLDFLV